jgi:hypothetical protein
MSETCAAGVELLFRLELQVLCKGNRYKIYIKASAFAHKN